MHAASHQSGWAFVVVLIALAIVAFLARGALTQWVDRTAAGGAATAAVAPRAEAGGQVPALRSPHERAQGVELTVQKRADDAGRRIDEAAR